jgi:hypothetical protein
MRHADVADHEVGHRPVEFNEAFTTIGRRSDGETFVDKDLLQGGADKQGVLDQ